MGFIDSYKHLEKLCGEVLNNDRRISAYIDEMKDIPHGSYYVRSWDEDLKKLKHYRWVRNQISHEPGCTEQNMCEPEDELWINEFYYRIMNQTDPLSLYRRATRPRPVTKTTSRPVQTSSSSHPYEEQEKSGYIAAIIVMLAACAIILISIWLYLRITQ